MPILHVRALPQRISSEQITRALVATSKAISEVYGCDESHVWTTWEELKPGLYVEGSKPAETQPDNTHPPLCELICFEGKSHTEIERILEAAAKTLSDALGIPNNIFMAYREAKSGEVIAGNGIVRRKGL